ncbi:type II toxin-antitoxin system PemK/MazF family toxin [Vagococcus fluvialis]|uniref:type II toxin-antitoxin system PemK/MazF family toxin n=1 Tax=Vagococcus fluvialis TaxID=2738 RepID=UPI0037B77468
MEFNENRASLCVEAHNSFLKEAHSDYGKYTYLPHWLKNKSIYLFNDRIKYEQGISNHKVYERGTIVFIDFGINVGSELSGNHFGIIIDNQDNEKNNVLTVIPISSKRKNCYIPIGRVISEQSMEYLEKDFKVKFKEIACMLVFLVKTEKIPYPKLDEALKPFYTKNSNISLKEAKKFLLERNINLTDDQSINLSLDDLIKNAHMSEKVFNKYKTYSTDSYAMPLNIQSISKQRIKRINRFDPSGEIKAPADVMNKIDLGILKSFTKIEINELTPEDLELNQPESIDN